jgi:hypothetical protein
MNRNRVFAATVAVIAVLAVGAFFYLSQQSGSQDTVSSSASAARNTVDTPPITEVNARNLERALVSSNKDEQSKALVPEIRQGEWSSTTALPKGAILTIDHPSFKTDGSGNGSVNAVVTGTVEGEFVLHLRYVDGQWLISSTEQKR